MQPSIKRLVGLPLVLILATSGCSKGGSRGQSVVQPPPGTHRVFSDAGVFDFLGSYHGPGDVITLALTSGPDAPEGTSYLEASATLNANGWAGLYVERGGAGGGETEDLTGYSGGWLRFAIRSNLDIEVGIRSDNIAPGAENSKALLRAQGLARLDGGWEDVTIPISEFLRREPRLRLATVQVLFSATLVASGLRGETGQFAIDNVRWVRD